MISGVSLISGWASRPRAPEPVQQEFARRGRGEERVDVDVVDLEEEPLDVLELIRAAVRNLGTDSADVTLDEREASAAPLALGDPARVSAELRQRLRELRDGFGASSDSAAHETTHAPAHHVRLEVETLFENRPTLRVCLVSASSCLELLLPIAGGAPLSVPRRLQRAATRLASR